MDLSASLARAFARHLVIIGSSGSSGSAGSKSGKTITFGGSEAGTIGTAAVVPLVPPTGRLPVHGTSGTTAREPVVPADAPPETAETLAFKGAGTTGTIGTGENDVRPQNAAGLDEGVIPPDWIDGVARLNPEMPPQDFRAGDWHQLVDNAGVLLSQWAAKAHALGWTTLELFGLHPATPHARFDRMGLVGPLMDNEVIAITADTATIRTASGATTTFYRAKVAPGGRPAWELDQPSAAPA